MIDGQVTNLKMAQRDGDVQGRPEAGPNLRLCVQMRSSSAGKNEVELNRTFISVYRNERGGNFHGKE